MDKGDCGRQAGRGTFGITMSDRSGRRLVLGLALAGAVAVVFGVRLGLTAVHWQERRETGVQGWMTAGFVAHAWQADRGRLEAALGVGAGERPTLAMIAARSGRDTGEVVAIVEDIVGAPAR
jgi:hypothetical protein